MDSMPMSQMMNMVGQAMSPTAEAAALCVATGSFDLAFIEAMILHHRSAIAMAQVALANAARPEVKELAQAIIDVAADPSRPGCHMRPEIAANSRTYHLRHSRDRVARRADRVHKPRHFLLFRFADDGAVEIGRVLHDSMDLTRHLPADYRRED